MIFVLLAIGVKLTCMARCGLLGLPHVSRHGSPTQQPAHCTTTTTTTLPNYHIA